MVRGLNAADFSVPVFHGLAPRWQLSISQPFSETVLPYGDCRFSSKPSSRLTCLSQPYYEYVQPTVSWPWCQEPIWDPWPSFISVSQLRVCWCGVTFPTRGGIYNLQLLLDSPAQSFSGPSLAGITTMFFCLRFETPPIWMAKSPYSYPLGSGSFSYIPRHWVRFSSPLTTRSATVETFKPLPRWVNLLASRPVYLSVGLSFGAHEHIPFFCLTISGFLMWGALSDEGCANYS
jgi:hypothetical protein